jgi:hypothetical protein
VSDIFISYASEDRPRAEMLAQTLEDRGWSTFWDRTIPIGKTWRETIGRELSGARCVIVLWKPRSNLVGCRKKPTPIGFRSIQAAHLENWDGTEPTQA